MDLLFSILSIKRLCYLILVALAVFWVKSATHHVEVSWFIWSAFLLSLITTGDSFKDRLSNIIITGLLAAFISFFIGSLTGTPLLQTLILFLLTLISVSIAEAYPVYFLQMSIVIIIAILSGHASPFIFICVGTAIAASLQIVFYPYYMRNEWQSYLMLSLKNLRKLNKEIFSCFIEPEYANNIYLYERRLHVSKNAFLHSLSTLRDISQNDNHAAWLAQLDALFQNMLDYSQLRRRVTDYTTFAVCREELMSIAKETDKCFGAVIAHALKKKYFPSVDQLVLSINRFETHYDQVLQVASREPLVFLLFINSLHAFGEKIYFNVSEQR